MTDGEKLVPLTVRLPEELLQKLREAAREDRRSVSADIVWLLEAAIRERGKKR